MKYFFNKALFYSLLFLIFNIKSDSLYFSQECMQPCKCNSEDIKTCLVPLSQGACIYTQYHIPFILKIDEVIKTDIRATYRFEQSYNGNEIAAKLFQFNPISFQGEILDGHNDIKRKNESLISTYFGMPNNANFSIYMNPSINNQIIDLQFSIGNDLVWFQLNIPITHSVWQMQNANLKGYYGNKSLQKYGSARFSTDTDGNLSAKEGLMKPDPTNDSIKSSAQINKILNNQNICSNSNFQDGKNNLQSMQSSLWKKISILSFSTDPTDTSKEISSNITKDITEQTIVNYASTNTAISQENILPAPNYTIALSGYTFGDLEKRLYSCFNLNNFSITNTKLGVSDLQLQLGIDAINSNQHHLGLYLKCVIPTGTKADTAWAKYNFSPFIGNGYNFEIGLGITMHKILMQNDNHLLKVYIDGFCNKILGNCQFRIFDKTNLPMSRYALIKEIIKNSINKKLEYNYNLYALADINNGVLPIEIDFNGQCMADLIYQRKGLEVGIGYMFQGQNKEYINESFKNNALYNNISSNIFYGFKSNSSEENINISNTPIESSPPTTQWILPNNNIPKTNNVNYISITSNNQVSDNKNAGAYKYGVLTKETSTNNLFYLPDFNNRSGLMEKQIINRFFFHIDYKWLNSDLLPFFGILLAYDFGTQIYQTIKYWQVGVRIGCQF